MFASEHFAAISALDLAPIKKKLMHAESGQGWSQERVDAVELEYRRFLCLMKMHPLESTAPMEDVDSFWHTHILDTMKYAADCEQVFGYFLHHFPYLGMRGEGDLAVLDQAGKRMGELYEAAFGEPYGAAAAAFCGVTVPDAKPAFCGVTVPDAKAAFCGAVAPDVKAAFCGAVAPEFKAAFCGAVAPDARPV